MEALTKALSPDAPSRRLTFKGRRLTVYDCPFETLKVSVTEDDIRGGIPGDPERCAVALSCHRVLGTGAIIIWLTRGLLELPGGTAWRVFFPKATAEFIANIDRADDDPEKKPVEAQEVFFLKPSAGNRIGAGNRGGPVGRARTFTGERQPREWRAARGNLSLRTTES